MAQPRDPRTSHLAPRTTHAFVAFVVALLALLPGTALAQEAGDADRDRVMLWTTIAVVLSLLAASVGYAYRRTRGMDHPTPDELEMMSADHGSHGEHGETPHGEAVHAHAEAEH